MLPLSGTKGGAGLFEAHDTGPPLVDIHTFGDLCELLGEPRHNATPVDATNFQRNHLALASSCILKKPVRVFLTLHPTNNAPRSVSMRQGQRHRLRTVLRNPIVVMLIDLAQVSPRPRKQPAAPDSFQVHADPYARRVVIPPERERRPSDHDQGEVGR